MEVILSSLPLIDPSRPPASPKPPWLKVRAPGGPNFIRLKEMAEDHPSVGDVRGQGLFAVMEMVKDRTTREPLAPWPRRPASLGKLVAEGRARGMSYFVRGNLVILCPPLVIEQDDLARGLQVLDELLELPDSEARQ